mmetsp:Transcript_34031/g.76601  ORF Transcript_34031/g.76601 Transcript_34031/m.76601 type:complete len:292 (-) Transcript_34031:1007-1882(-)
MLYSPTMPFPSASAPSADSPSASPGASDVLIFDRGHVPSSFRTSSMSATFSSFSVAWPPLRLRSSPMGRSRSSIHPMELSLVPGVCGGGAPFTPTPSRSQRRKHVLNWCVPRPRPSLSRSTTSLSGRYLDSGTNCWNGRGSPLELASQRNTDAKSGYSSISYSSFLSSMPDLVGELSAPSANPSLCCGTTSRDMGGPPSCHACSALHARGSTRTKSVCHRSPRLRLSIPSSLRSMLLSILPMAYPPEAPAPPSPPAASVKCSHVLHHSAPMTFQTVPFGPRGWTHPSLARG